jgi:hypothetical protein
MSQHTSGIQFLTKVQYHLSEEYSCAKGNVYLKVRVKTTNLLQDSKHMDKSLWPWVWKCSLRYRSQSTKNKGTENKLNFIKIKHFCAVNNMIKKLKRYAQNGEKNLRIIYLEEDLDSDSKKKNSVFEAWPLVALELHHSSLLSCEQSKKKIWVLLPWTLARVHTTTTTILACACGNLLPRSTH